MINLTDAALKAANEILTHLRGCEENKDGDSSPEFLAELITAAAEQNGKRYAEVVWMPEDVQSVFELNNPGKTITREAAERWLERNAKHIRDRLTACGHEVIETLLFDDEPT